MDKLCPGMLSESCSRCDSPRRHCRWDLTLFLLIKNNQTLLYFCKVISTSVPLWRRIGNINLNGKRFNKIFSRTIKFSDFFFPSCISDWNEHEEELKNAINLKSFRSSLLKLARPPKSSNFKIIEKIVLLHLAQLIVALNDLK